MHYYRRNLGDYAKKAGRLSMLQHGAYTLLLDACYDREQFPTEDQAIEWTWASTPEEEQAVKFVLSRFFELQEDKTYVQTRVYEELQVYKIGEIQNRLIAIAREAKKKKQFDLANECDQLRAKIKNDPLSNTHEAWTELVDRVIKQHERTPNHKPLTTNHKPLTTNQEGETPQTPQNPPPSPDESFCMFPDWEPKPQFWEGVCQRAGCDPNYKPVIEEFRLYWSSESRKLTESQWQGKLLAEIKKQYQKTKYVHGGNGSDNFHNITPEQRAELVKQFSTGE